MPITDDDLHAWLDGELSHERMQQVASYLAAHPDEAQRVAAWRAQNEALRALYDPILDDSPPPRLLRAVLQPQPAWRWRLSAASPAGRYALFRLRRISSGNIRRSHYRLPFRRQDLYNAPPLPTPSMPWMSAVR